MRLRAFAIADRARVRGVARGAERAGRPGWEHAKGSDESERALAGYARACCAFLFSPFSSDSSNAPAHYSYVPAACVPRAAYPRAAVWNTRENEKEAKGMGQSEIVAVKW